MGAFVLSSFSNLRVKSPLSPHRDRQDVSSLPFAGRVHGENLSSSPGLLLAQPVTAGWEIGQPGWGVGREDGESGWAGVEGEWPGPAPLGLKVSNFTS